MARSTSSTMALTSRSFDAETMTNSSATTSTSPTSMTTMSWPPLASAARAAVMASSRAEARSFRSVRGLLPLGQVFGVVAEDHGHIDLVVGRDMPILPARQLFDAPDTDIGLQPRGERGAFLAGVDQARLLDIQGGRVAGDGDLGAARHQGAGRQG